MAALLLLLPWLLTGLPDSGGSGDTFCDPAQGYPMPAGCRFQVGPADGLAIVVWPTGGRLS